MAMDPWTQDEADARASQRRAAAEAAAVRSVTARGRASVPGGARSHMFIQAHQGVAVPQSQRHGRVEPRRVRQPRPRGGHAFFRPVHSE